MQTIRLRVNDKVYKNLLWFLSKFSKDELQIIEENEEFLSVRKDLHKALDKVEKGNEDFINQKQLDDELEATIRKYAG